MDKTRHIRIKLKRLGRAFDGCYLTLISAHRLIRELLNCGSVNRDVQRRLLISIAATLDAFEPLAMKRADAPIDREEARAAKLRRLGARQGAAAAPEHGIGTEPASEN